MLFRSLYLGGTSCPLYTELKIDKSDWNDLRQATSKLNELRKQILSSPPASVMPSGFNPALSLKENCLLRYEENHPVFSALFGAKAEDCLRDIILNGSFEEENLVTDPKEYKYEIKQLAMSELGLYPSGDKTSAGPLWNSGEDPFYNDGGESFYYWEGWFSPRDIHKKISEEKLEELHSRNSTTSDI